MNQSHSYRKTLILKRTITVLILWIVLISSATVNAQGLMRGEASTGGASSAQSAEIAETINYLNDDQFQADLNVNALSVISDDELQFEVRKLITENQKLKAEVEAQQELKYKIVQLESTIQDMEDGWEIVKQ